MRQRLACAPAALANPPTPPSAPMQHAALVADKEQELARVQAEKNASLESLVRATASATAEAGKLVSEAGAAGASVCILRTQPLANSLSRPAPVLQWPKVTCVRLLHRICGSMVFVTVTDTAWLEGGPAAAQNEQHETTKAALHASQQQAQQLQGELSSLQAEFAAACSAQAALVTERSNLEKRVG